MKTLISIILFIIALISPVFVDSPIVTRRYATLVYFGAGWRF
jgi:hypothetical protein